MKNYQFHTKTTEKLGCPAINGRDFSKAENKTRQPRLALEKVNVHRINLVRQEPNIRTALDRGKN